MEPEKKTNIVEVKTQRRIGKPRFREAAHVRNVWSIDVPETDNIDDLLQPDYWQHVAELLRPGDKIEAMWDDMSKSAEFIVISAARIHARVFPLRVTDHFDEAASGDDGYTDGMYSQFRGRFHKWTAKRGSEVIKHGFGTREEADAFIADYRKNVLKVA